MTGATALPVEVVITARGEFSATSAFTVPTDDPVFTGHYPGFPVMPGVFLVEAADQTVRSWASDPVELATMDRCRFSRPVYPGERVVTDVAVIEEEGGVRIKATSRTDEGKVAEIRLSYRYASEETE